MRGPSLAQHRGMSCRDSGMRNNRLTLSVLVVTLGLIGSLLLIQQVRSSHHAVDAPTNVSHTRDVTVAKLYATALTGPAEKTAVTGPGPCGYYHALHCWVTPQPFDAVLAILIQQLTQVTGHAPAEKCSEAAGAPDSHRCVLTAPVGTSSIVVQIRQNATIGDLGTKYPRQRYILVQYAPLPEEEQVP
jgi:hypothetical protein